MQWKELTEDYYGYDIEVQALLPDKPDSFSRTTIIGAELVALTVKCSKYSQRQMFQFKPGSGNNSWSEGFNLAVPRRFSSSVAAMAIGLKVAEVYGYDIADSLVVEPEESDELDRCEYVGRVHGPGGKIYCVCEFMGEPVALELRHKDGSRELFSLDLREKIGTYPPST